MKNNQLASPEGLDWVDVTNQSIPSRQLSVDIDLNEEPKPGISKIDLARWIASGHQAVDPGIKEVIYLPNDAPEESIRLVAINELTNAPESWPLGVVDFTPKLDGIDFTVEMADISPNQWEMVQKGDLKLPKGWSLDENFAGSFLKMNPSQRLYYLQAQADFEIFDLIQGKAACHLLHFLQMATEKLAKAYFYGKSGAVERQHVGFAKFVRALATEPKMWKEFGFARRFDFLRYLQEVSLLAKKIELLAPALAQDGPNPEYPWPPPPAQPIQAPILFDFPLWKELNDTDHGRKLVEFIRRLVGLFPQRF